MDIHIPYNIGDKIIIDGKKEVIHAVYIYVGKQGASNIRLYLGRNEGKKAAYVTVKREGYK